MASEKAAKAPKKKRATRKRVSKRERELKPVFGKLTEIVASGTADRTTVRDLHYARLLHEGSEQIAAYELAYKPQTDNRQSLAVMASRLAKKPNVMREMDRLRREDDEESNRLDKLEDLLLDGERMKMEMLKVVYLLATSPDTQDAVRLKAALEIGNLKHVDAFAKAGTTINIDKSQTQNNVIGIGVQDAGELRTKLKSAIAGFLEEGPVTIAAPNEEADVIEVEAIGNEEGA